MISAVSAWGLTFLWGTGSLPVSSYGHATFGFIRSFSRHTTNWLMKQNSLFLSASTILGMLIIFQCWCVCVSHPCWFTADLEEVKSLRKQSWCHHSACSTWSLGAGEGEMLLRCFCLGKGSGWAVGVQPKAQCLCLLPKPYTHGLVKSTDYYPLLLFHVGIKESGSWNVGKIKNDWEPKLSSSQFYQLKERGKPEIDV